jgi:predicted Rdx family selenoprotein
MSDAVITLHVLRRGPRAQELLTDVAERLGLDALEPDDHGVVRVRLGRRGPQAWDAVNQALDAAGPDWRERLHLSPRPNR